MRQIPCVNAAYYTTDGYMAQRPYVPGETHEYKAYAIGATEIQYGATATFAVPKVKTGNATEIGQVNARLGVTVDNVASGRVSECGVCWGPVGTPINFVTQLGTDGVRCMRQIPCINAAYYTTDGYMAQRPYVLGTRYAYRGYAITDAADVAHGSTKTFTAGGAPTVTTVYQHDNYAGYSAGLTEGTYSLSALQLRGVVNDDLSSVKVSSGYVAHLFQDDGFKGTLLARKVDTPSLNAHAFNDAASSIIVTSETNQSVRYQRRNSKDYFLTVLNPSGLETAILDRLINAWSQKYAAMAARFNTNSATSLRLVVDPNYTAFAYASGTTIDVGAGPICPRSGPRSSERSSIPCGRNMSPTRGGTQESPSGYQRVVG